MNETADSRVSPH